MSDNMQSVYDKFFEHRRSPLRERYAGVYRALVVETNDPLNMNRIRFRCPDLHDWTLTPQDCPWAVPAPWMGGKSSGSWSSPCIGDWVWIDFERGHPYGPVWIGHATPTRRRYYPLPSISQPSPVSVNETGVAVSAPVDYNSDYLPRDGRPMCHGVSDRYGNMDISSSVGFYPIEHNLAPPPPDFDPVDTANFRQGRATPAVNSPDAKYMGRVSKYGHMVIMGDQGYSWRRNGEYGEFNGDHDRDAAFETARWRYLQRLINEDHPSGHDQRNYLELTRYGHKFEMRDTGWAQPGPRKSKSRRGEYGEPVYLSAEETNDFRWVKLRTKGGWLLQAYDKGFDPQDDLNISRLLMDETGHKTEREDVHWANKDARWFRIVGRHGYKFVIDERGTDSRDSAGRENPRGNGFLMKGRRTGGCKTEGVVDGDPRGFYFEINENDDANHTTWGSPLGQAVEMNDATEYMALSVGLGRDYARPFRGLEENEFLLEPTRKRDPEARAYHLVMDHQNEYLRLKTRGGRGDRARDAVNPTGLGGDDLNQGLEARDGSKGDGPWVELVDSQGRGLWFSRKNNLAMLRSRNGKKLYIWLNDADNEIVLYNGEDDGKLRMFSRGSIDIVSDGAINLKGDSVNIKSTGNIQFEENGNRARLNNGNLRRGDRIEDLRAIEPPRSVGPTDRGKVYNTPSVVDVDEVEHPVR